MGELIDQCGGFEEYILGTPVCEMNSMLGNLLKRDMLSVISEESSFVNARTKTAAKSEAEFEALKDAYKEFRVPGDRIEWIGLPLPIALHKQLQIEIANGNPRYTDAKPLRQVYDEMVEDRVYEMEGEGDWE